MDSELPRCAIKTGTNIVRIPNVSSGSASSKQAPRSDSEASKGEESSRGPEGSSRTAGRWSQEEQLLFIEGTQTRHASSDPEARETVGLG